MTFSENRPSAFPVADEILNSRSGSTAGDRLGAKLTAAQCRAMTKPSDKNQNQNGDDANGSGKSENPFDHAPPDGHAKKVSEVLGEIVWLMSQSPLHKQFFISDLEWFVMTPVLLKQFRMFYAQNKPIGVVFWAKVSDEVEQRLKAGVTKLRPQDWRSGEKTLAVEVVAPFGGAKEMVSDTNKTLISAPPSN